MRRPRLNVDAHRYPLRALPRVSRTVLLLGGCLFVLYLPAVAINLIQLLRLAPAHPIDRSELVRALLLPSFLGDPSAPAIAFVPFALVLAGLVAGGVWAIRDGAVERAVLLVRARRHERGMRDEAPHEQRSWLPAQAEPVTFSAYHPKEVAPEEWAPLIVFAAQDETSMDEQLQAETQTQIQVEIRREFATWEQIHPENEVR